MADTELTGPDGCKSYASSSRRPQFIPNDTPSHIGSLDSNSPPPLARTVRARGPPPPALLFSALRERVVLRDVDEERSQTCAFFFFLYDGFFLRKLSVFVRKCAPRHQEHLPNVRGLPLKPRASWLPEAGSEPAGPSSWSEIELSSNSPGSLKDPGVLLHRPRTQTPKLPPVWLSGRLPGRPQAFAPRSLVCLQPPGGASPTPGLEEKGKPVSLWSPAGAPTQPTEDQGLAPGGSWNQRGWPPGATGPRPRKITLSSTWRIHWTGENLEAG
ncbi:uncharacterized protein ACOB8E_018258 [Sarcophilus harrisii]